MSEPRAQRSTIAPAFLCVVMVMLVPAPGTAQDATHLRATVFVTGLTAPVAFVQDPTQPNVQFVVEQGGLIRVVRDGQLLAGAFLDLSASIASGGERGLLGLAFAPDYGVSRRFYVNFTDLSGNTVVARFLRSATDAMRADASTRFDLRWPDGNRFISQPFANHNGGDLHFGSDGYLYIGMGDGGSGNDPGHNAQNPASLLGKMLRIDVAVPASDAEGYDVPFDNPFVGNGAFLPEIWALGVRNPFRFTVDALAHGGNGALVIGDVGQNAWEEVDFDPFGRGGRNYGWRNREGSHDNVMSLPPATVPLIDPVIEYSHAEGNVITGGVVYRGSALGLGFFSRYFYSDFGASRVWSARLIVNPATGEAVAAGVTEHLFGTPVGNISAFGIDAACEIYMVDYTGGRLLRLDPAAGAAGTGCATPDPFLALGGGAWLNGTWFPPDHPLAAGLGQIAGTPDNSGCTTPQPASTWVCLNGGWLPPDHPLVTGASSPPTGTGAQTPPSTACTTPQPASTWVCIDGGWLPPDHPLAAGASTPPAGTPAPPGGPGTPPSTACTTPQPASTWVCIDGGWLPPDHPLAAGASTPPAGTPAPPGGPGTPPTTVCTTIMPAAGWVCVNGGWLPPDHPLAAAAAAGAPPGEATCIGPDPFAGIPGLVGVCVNGGWIPRVVGG